jgi:hypothetical protein
MANNVLSLLPRLTLEGFTFNSPPLLRHHGVNLYHRERLIQRMLTSLLIVNLEGYMK